MVICLPKTMGVNFLENLVLQSFKYTEFPMGRYFDNSCTSSVVCTVYHGHFYFSTGGGRAVCQPPGVWLLFCILANVLFRFVHVPDPLHVIKSLFASTCMLGWGLWMPALMHSSGFRFVGCTCHAQGQLLETSSWKLMHSRGSSLMTTLAIYTAPQLFLPSYWSLCYLRTLCSPVDLTAHADFIVHFSGWASIIDWGQFQDIPVSSMMLRVVQSL